MVSHLRILPFSSTRQSGPYVVIIFKTHLAAADPHFLASGVSNDLVLHFVLFVPSASRRPLYILDANSKFHGLASRLLIHPYNQTYHRTRTPLFCLNGAASSFTTHLPKRHLKNSYLCAISTPFSTPSPSNSSPFSVFQSSQTVFVVRKPAHPHLY